MVLAIDPGERRTGIAACDPTGMLASPVCTHDRRRDGSLLELLARLVSERGAERLLVGLPRTAGGGEGSQAVHARQLATKIADHIDIPVELVDERFSTAEASRLLQGRRHERGDRDALAAALVLQGWLDGRRGGGGP